MLIAFHMRQRKLRQTVLSNGADQSYLLLFFFLTFETLRLKTAKTWKVAAAYERTIKEKSICVSADGSLVNDCTHVHR